MNFTFDLERVMNNVEGDLEFVRELIDLFSTDVPKQLGELKGFLNEDDPEKVWHAAHSIKGAVGNFTKGPSWQTAFALECAGKNGDLSQGSSLLADLETHLEQLISELHAFADEEKQA